jgi:hypothetical protein
MCETPAAFFAKTSGIDNHQNGHLLKNKRRICVQKFLFSSLHGFYWVKIIQLNLFGAKIAV